MIICEGIRKSYPAGHSRREILKGINLTVQHGDAGKGAAQVNDESGVELEQRQVGRAHPGSKDGTGQNTGARTEFDDPVALAQPRGHCTSQEARRWPSARAGGAA